MSDVATAVRERPIPFCGEMVRAIIAGSKTATRRVIDPQPTRSRPIVAVAEDGVWRCPYGVVGDRLWVKEALRVGVHHDSRTLGDLGGNLLVRYEADATSDVEAGWGRYRHARFMPRKFARIVLEITEVRPERLHDITSCDCALEGIAVDVSDVVGAGRVAVTAERRLTAFRALWESLHGADGWRANPWIWALTFKQVTP